MTDHVTPDIATYRARLWQDAHLPPLARLARDYPAAFARMIARQRKAMGLSYRAVAARCDVSHDTVRSLECMRWPTPNHHSIITVADALALTIDDLRAEIAAMNDEVIT